MVDLPSGVVPVQVVTDTPFVLFQNVAPKPQSLNDRRLDRTDVHVHAVGAEAPKRAHGSVLASEIDDCVGFGGIEIRVKARARDEQ